MIQAVLPPVQTEPQSRDRGGVTPVLSPGLAKSQPRECQGPLGFGGNEAQAGMWELWGTWDVTSFAGLCCGRLGCTNQELLTQDGTPGADPSRGDEPL